MPREYRKKNGACGARPYLTKYTAEEMEKAIKAVQDGKSIRATAKQFGVPCSTLSDKVKGKG